MLLRSTWALSFLLFFNACALLKALEPKSHSLFIKMLEQPLTSLRAIVVAQMPVGQRSMSSNGRELVSRYFVPGKDGTYRDGEKANERYFVQYTLLGDMRPYEIEVQVLKEKRILHGTEFVYEVYGPDDRLTKELHDRLRKELTKRREERNVIDDFRVY